MGPNLFEALAGEGLTLRDEAPEVRVFLVDDMPADSFVLAGRLLSAGERERAARLRVPTRRREFTVGRALLRSLLAAACGIEPAGLQISLAPTGKPRLSNPGAEVRFNVSHSHGAVAVALARGREVGVDVEKVRAGVRTRQIAARYFSEKENRGLAQLEGSDHLTAFFSCWTRKEAVVKALGEGLSLPLSSFDVSLDPDRAELLETRWRQGRAIRLHHVAAPRGYRAAAAVLSG